MNIADYIVKLEKVQKELPQKANEIAKEVAQLGTDTVRVRSIADGINVNGIEDNKQEYSKYPIGTSRFIGKELNQAGREFIKKYRLGTWEDFREVQGLQGGNINLSYSGDMWASIKIQSQSTGQGQIGILIGSDDSKVNAYIVQLSKRYGNFIRPTIKEESDLKIVADAKMRTYLISELNAK